MVTHRVGTGGNQTLELLADYLGHEANNVLGAIGCIGAGAIGAFVWGFSFGGPRGMTSSWLATVIGLFIAIFCIVFRGRGKAMALLAAFMALAAVFAGHFFGAWLTLNRDWSYRERLMLVREVEDNTDTSADTAKLLRSLGRFKQIKGEGEYPAFILEHNFEIGKPDRQVSDAELAQFKQHWAPLLKRWLESSPKQNEMHGQVLDVHIDIYEQDFKAKNTLTELATGNLNFFDAFFALLGAMVAGAVVTLVSGKLELRRQAEEKKKREAAERAPLPKLAPLPAKKQPGPLRPSTKT